VSDFDALQAVIRRHAEARQADQQACEAFLNALYRSLRRASGPGLPLNNVSLDPVADPAQGLRPVPVGAYHAAWFRLGLCEVLVRVRRDGRHFRGEYAGGLSFELHSHDEDALTVLARRMLRDIGQVYGGPEGEGTLN
jgi:hypothetical protein